MLDWSRSRSGQSAREPSSPRTLPWTRGILSTWGGACVIQANAWRVSDLGKGFRRRLCGCGARSSVSGLSDAGGGEAKALFFAYRTLWLNMALWALSIRNALNIGHRIFLGPWLLYPALPPSVSGTTSFKECRSALVVVAVCFLGDVCVLALQAHFLDLTLLYWDYTGKHSRHVLVAYLWMAGPCSQPGASDRNEAAL